MSTVKINGENVTVYTKWNDVMYMLTVHITSMNVSTQQMYSGENINLGRPAQEGYNSPGGMRTPSMWVCHSTEQLCQTPT